MAEWLKIARDPVIVWRALRYAVIVGAVLIAINHGDAILRGNVSVDRLFKMGLTILVPYCVSTASSVGALREMQKKTESENKGQIRRSA